MLTYVRVGKDPDLAKCIALLRYLSSAIHVYHLYMRIIISFHLIHLDYKYNYTDAVLYCKTFIFTLHYIV